jgi:hypothetical protein
MWSCPDCAGANKELWAKKIAHGISVYWTGGLIAQFMTITNHEENRGEKSIESWPRVWGKFSTRFRRAFGNPRYVQIPEKHQDGTLHAHLLVATYYPVSERWLKDNMRSCGGGYIDTVEACEKLIQAAFYVTKYITKSLETGEWVSRRIRTSQHWPVLPQGEQQEKWLYLGMACMENAIETAVGQNAVLIVD